MEEFIIDSTNCIFCKLGRGVVPSPGPYYGLFSVEELSSQILMETLNFFVISDAGPIVPGYTNIIPRLHSLSIASLPNKLYFEFLELIDKTRSVLETHFGKCIAFEHGSGKNYNSASSITHAHLHLLPTSIDFVSQIEKEYSISRYDNFTSFCDENKNSSYLLVIDQKGRIYGTKLFNKIPTQYLRRRLAHSLCIKIWAWQQYHTPSRKKLTKKRILKLYNLFN